MTDNQSNIAAQDISLHGFNFEGLRLRQDYTELAVEKVISSIPVRKPLKMEFVRVHPDMRFETTILDDDGEIYLVPPAFHTEVWEYIHPVCLCPTINRQGVLTLWPLKLGGPDGKICRWYQTALDAASRAKTRWVRVKSNRSLGGYETFVGLASLPEPEWPELSMEEIMKIAFQNFIIDHVDHPILRRVRGEI